KRFGRAGVLPPVEAIDITHADRDGDLFAKPVKWDSDAPPPTIIVVQPRGKHPKDRRFTVGVGDRVLAKLSPAGEDTLEARPIKKLAEAPARLLGVYEARAGDERWAGRLRPVDKRYRHEVVIAHRDVGDAQSGDLVSAEIINTPRHGAQHA